MNSQSHSTNDPASSDDEPSDLTSPEHGRRVRIRRSSGEYEYVTPERLSELNKQRRIRSKRKKRIRKGIRFAAVIVTVISIFYVLLLIDAGRTPVVETIGTIQVTCNVNEATIYVDGNPVSQTKGRITIVEEISLGIHEISIRKTGFSAFPESIAVQVSDFGTVPLEFTLTREDAPTGTENTDSLPTSNDNNQQPAIVSKASTPDTTIQAQTEIQIQTDTSPPVITRLITPRKRIDGQQVSFAWSADGTAFFSTFLDGYDSGYSGFLPIQTVVYQNLPQGEYTFYVRARDIAGNITPIPTSYTFRVDTIQPSVSAESGLSVNDTTPPNTTITQKPAAMTSRNTIAFGFTSNEAAQFSYYLDGRDKEFSPYVKASRATYSNLPDGTYTFSVRARDGAGNVDPIPASVEFTIDATPPQPEIVQSPPSTTEAQAVQFRFKADRPAVFSYYLAGHEGGYSNYTQDFHKTYNYLPDGDYTFHIRAKGTANSVESDPVSYAFTVKTAEIIWQEGFERKALHIKAGDFNETSDRDFWGKSSARTKSGEFSLWCSSEGNSKENYDSDMQAWYEIEADLSGYRQAKLSLWYYLDTTNDISDQFTLRAAPNTKAKPNSHEGFRIIWIAPVSKEKPAGWVQTTVAFDEMVGQPIVLRLCFDSDGELQDEGVYIDDLQIICKY